nr:hypothetical protein [Nocardia crassostreae]
MQIPVDAQRGTLREAWVGVQIAADERAHTLDPHIDLIAPSRVDAELTASQARTLADLLVGAADNGPMVPARPCPSWCVRHPPSLVADPFRHHGEPQRLRVRGPQLHDAFVATQLVGFDVHSVSPVLRVRLHLPEKEWMDVTPTQARRVAAALYDAVDAIAARH